MAVPALIPTGFGPRIRISLSVLGGILATGLLFVVSMRFIGEYCEDFLRVDRPPTFEEATAAIPIEYALSSTEANDVVFLGDSTLVWGIDSLQFERLTGLKAYNLGSLMLLSADGMLLTAKAYLSKHPTPRALVLCLSPVAPGYSQAESLLAQRFVRTYGHRLGIVNSDSRDTEWDLVKHGTAIVGDYANAFLTGHFRGCRDDLIAGAIPGYTYNRMTRIRCEGRGHDRLPGKHGPPDAWSLPTVHIAVSPEWNAGVRALVRLAQTAKTKLFIQLSPLPAKTVPANFVDVVGWLREVQKDFPHAVVNDAIPFLDWELFWDNVHVNAKGSEQFTNLVAHNVRAAINNGDRRAEATTESSDTVSRSGRSWSPSGELND